jgi:hypothetical protein
MKASYQVLDLMEALRSRETNLEPGRLAVGGAVEGGQRRGRHEFRISNFEPPEAERDHEFGVLGEILARSEGR